jgi:hypothetical protein
MEWEKIIWAIALSAMILLILPRTKEMMQQSTKVTWGEWITAIIPLALVVGFVILLIILVR